MNTELPKLQTIGERPTTNHNSSTENHYIHSRKLNGRRHQSWPSLILIWEPYILMVQIFSVPAIDETTPDSGAKELWVVRQNFCQKVVSRRGYTNWAPKWTLNCLNCRLLERYQPPATIQAPKIITSTQRNLTEDVISLAHHWYED